jgi:glutamine amidotransferase
MIAVVDYGLGNVASVRNALRATGAEAELTSDPERIRRATGVVLPGVGAASAGMERLRARALDGVVQEVAQEGKPLLGICLGMQLLFDRSEEGSVECLGVIPGTVRLLHGQEKVPHIGWNQVAPRAESELWYGLPAELYFYFVHSYVCDPRDLSVSAGTTEYGETFCSAVQSGSVWGTQFHPERSGRVGLQLIRNFVERCR